MAAARSPGSPLPLFSTRSLLSLSFVPRIRRSKSENIYRVQVTITLSLREKRYVSLYPNLSFVLQISIFAINMVSRENVKLAFIRRSWINFTS